MEKKPLLEVKQLTTTFKTGGVLFHAVDKVSFTLYAGETIGIVGESGSGKSVTSLSLMRLIPNPPGKITGGEIIFHHQDGTARDLVQLSEEEMRTYRGNKLAMIFQEPMTSLNPVLTCGEQVMEAILLHKKGSREDARKKTIALFEEVQLPLPEQMYSRYPHQLSGGQKQRVMIAMAMSCEPNILIADEPTTALDVTVQKTILELMKKLQTRYNMGIIFITHDLGVVSELADKVLVMYKGKVVEEGQANQVFTSAKHPYTKGLLACKPPLDSRPERLATVSDFLELNTNGEFVERAGFVTNHRIQKMAERTNQTEKLLEVKNLSIKFPAKKNLFGKVLNYSKALDDISFDVFRGETLGLVGESGCGKTTLGRSILKLIAAGEGSILYKGKDILKLSEREFKPMRSKMQIIFQDPYSSLNPRIPIGEAIAEPMRVHGLQTNETSRREKVNELLQKVGLNAAHYNRYPHEFSGGQRQRICIARALGLEPEFIICDESVSALDVSVQAQVLNLLNDLKQEFGFTSIFISHDLSVVKYMSDRMMVMRKGKIEEMGDAQELYAHPKSQYTRALIDSIPKMKQHL
ncbi:MAG: ABC transporter ATP-binding protein [Bacteroidia bacterium]|jgi:peptide/nickel transport system ATP-binding protein|nr:ABC transporter ATP-binding protein [Bacteroidia bacterium]